MMQKKSVYFVPMRQDDPVKKPHSLVADFGRIEECADAALAGKQVYPVFE